MTTKGPAQHHRAGPFNTSNIVNNNDAIIARKNDGQQLGRPAGRRQLC